MTAAIDILRDGFERVRDNVESVLDGLTPEQVLARPGPDANSIGWLVWHLSRVQDSHLADLVGAEQVWSSEGFVERFQGLAVVFGEFVLVDVDEFVDEIFFRGFVPLREALFP